MTDFSQLPHLNSVAPFCEERLVRSSPIGILAQDVLITLSWLSVALLALCLWNRYELSATPGPRCGNGRPWSVESQSWFVVVSLGIWFLFARFFPNKSASAKRPALVAVILWCGIGGGILVGDSWHIAEIQQTAHRRF
jgi:hypothetical protein